MLIQETAFAYLVCHHLVESGSIQVRCLFRLDQFADDLLRCNNPGQANTGSQQFGEGAQVDDITGVTRRRRRGTGCRATPGRGDALLRSAAVRMGHLLRWELRNGLQVRPAFSGVPG